jgi:WD40 repeat protein
MAAIFLSGTPAQPPALPAINPAAARLDATATGLDGPGFAIVADEASGTVAAACERGSIRYWRKDVVLGVRSGDRTPNLLRGHQGPVLSLARHRAAPLASAGADQKVILWDLAAARPRFTITPGTAIRCLAYAPDGKLLAGGGDDARIHLWDPSTGKPREVDGKPLQLQGHTDWLLSLAFSPDGKWLASAGHDGTIRLWELTSQKKQLDIPAQPSPAPKAPPEPAPSVTALAFSPDSKLLAAGNVEAQVHLFNVADGKFVRTLAGHTSTVTGLVFHPSGTVLVSASKDRTLRLWNPGNGQVVKTLEGHTSWVQGVALLAQGTRLTSVGADRTVRMWDLTNPPAK